jgi:EPS-associated MarR family transcriptional regulator
MTSRQAKIQEDTHFRIMRILQENPDLTQRELAEKLGMSVGGLNYCLNALIDKGLVKMQNFSNSKNKFKYVYLLTPMGIAEKVALTTRFLSRKMEEYEALKLEIEALKSEVDAPSARQNTKSMIQVTPVILCGGSGTRLWPLSRTGFPKQFLCLTGNESLFQQAAQRLAALGNDSIQVAAPVIVSGEDHRFLASEQLREVGIALGTALLEPTGRNTAPALTLAALAAVQNGQDPVLVVTPADQTIANPAAFTAAVQQAIAQAEQGNIVILGVTPDKPETGYGYIKVPSLRGAQRRGNPTPDRPSLRRKAQPSHRRRLPQEGGYYWNAGMFVLKASVWLAAIEQFAPPSCKPPAPHGPPAKQTAPLCAPAKPSLKPSPPSRWTTPSWSTAPAAHSPSKWCRSMPAGTTWAHGTPSGKCSPKTHKATPMWATCCTPTATTPWCTPAAAWWRWWA